MCDESNCAGASSKSLDLDVRDLLIFVMTGESA